MRVDHLARAPVNMAMRSSRAVVVGEVERIVELLLAGPFPELVGRAVFEDGLLERLAAEASAASERQGEPLEQALERVVERLVASQAFQEALVQALDSPAVRRAAARQATGVGAEIGAALRRRCSAWDDAVEEVAHRWAHRAPARDDTRRYAGVATRLAAFAGDALLVHLLFLVALISVTLSLSLLRIQVGRGTAAVGLGTGYAVVAIAYFAGFWSAVGSTPAMRVLQIRVLGKNGRPPAPLRSLLRAVLLMLAVLPFLLGLLPALLGDRRRAVDDLVSGTVVLRDQRASSDG